MKARGSRIGTDVDFEADGKQVSWLRLPHSSNESAYGWIGVPIAVVKNGEGPTLLLMAGNHGDEFEGQIALAKLVREIDPAQIRGRLVVIPVSNVPAAMAGTRVSPIDDGNLNRSFPGDPDGPPTAMIAHYLSSVVLPMCDAVADLHSGGRTLHYLPSALTSLSAEGELRERVIAAVRAFGAPYAYLTPAGGENRTLLATALRLGVTAIGTELGGSGAVSAETVRIADRGVRNLLAHFGLVDPADDPPPGDAPATRLLEVDAATHFVWAPDRGVFEPAFELGQSVRAGELAGRLHFVDDPLREPVAIHFDGDGLVICRRVPARTERGDCLAHLARDHP